MRRKNFLRVIACSIVDVGNLLSRCCKLRLARGGGALGRWGEVGVLKGEGFCGVGGLGKEVSRGWLCSRVFFWNL